MQLSKKVKEFPILLRGLSARQVCHRVRAVSELLSHFCNTFSHVHTCLAAKYKYSMYPVFLHSADCFIAMPINAKSFISTRHKRKRDRICLKKPSN